MCVPFAVELLWFWMDTYARLLQLFPLSEATQVWFKPQEVCSDVMTIKRSSISFRFLSMSNDYKQSDKAELCHVLTIQIMTHALLAVLANMGHIYIDTF